MNAKKVGLEEFLKDALVVLADVEQNLHRLAQTALAHYQSTVTTQENGSDRAGNETDLWLPQLSKHLADLSERSRFLQTYLQGAPAVLPMGDDSWPRIRILQSQEEERVQLARELEAGIGQLLANAVFELASSRNMLADCDEAVAAGLDALQSELEAGLADVRQLIVDLEPGAILSNFGLGAGVRRYLEQFETRTGLKTDLQIKTNPGRLPSIIELAIFRVIREALQNVAQHARASQVVVVFEEDAGQLHFSITDDGEGLTPEKVSQTRKSLGLARMVDYAELLNSRRGVISLGK